MLLYLYQLKCASSATCVTRYFRSLQEASTGAIALCNCRLRSQCPRPFCCAALCYLWPYTHTHMGKCVCAWVCAQSVCKQTAYKAYTRPGQARLGRQRPVDMPNRRRRPAASPLYCPFFLCAHCAPLVLYCVCVCRILRVGSIRLDKQDDQGRLQLSSFKRMPPVVALWQRERVELPAAYCPRLPPSSVSSLHHPCLGYGSSTKPISQKTKKA